MSCSLYIITIVYILLSILKAFTPFSEYKNILVVKTVLNVTMLTVAIVKTNNHIKQEKYVREYIYY